MGETAPAQRPMHQLCPTTAMPICLHWGIVEHKSGVGPLHQSHFHPGELMTLRVHSGLTGFNFTANCVSDKALSSVFRLPITPSRSLSFLFQLDSLHALPYMPPAISTACGILSCYVRLQGASKQPLCSTPEAAAIPVIPLHPEPASWGCHRGQLDNVS